MSMNVEPGMRFRNYEVLRMVRDCKEKRMRVWECRCDCGRIEEISGRTLVLRKGDRCAGCCERGSEKRFRRPKIVIRPGDRYGQWTVLERSMNNGVYGWQCRCDCGRESFVMTGSLTSGRSNKCMECSRSERRLGTVFPGNVYNNYTVLRLAKDSDRNIHRMWECRCKCGAVSMVQESTLRNKNRKKCTVCSIADAREHNSRAKHYVGEHIGKWELIQRDSERNQWLCRCECGTERFKNISDLMRAKTPMCRKCKDAQHGERLRSLGRGMRIGLLTIQGRVVKADGISRRVCVCTCGRMDTIDDGELLSGRVTHCRYCDGNGLEGARKNERTNTRKREENAQETAKNQSEVVHTVINADEMTRAEFMAAHPKATLLRDWILEHPKDTYNTDDWIEYVKYYDRRRMAEKEAIRRLWKHE